MIERHWKGVAKPGEASNYIKHLQKDTFPKLKEIEGFISARILKRDVPEGVEFLIITVWESIDVISRFAGEHIQIAVVPTAVEAMMIRYDPEVNHYTVEAI